MDKAFKFIKHAVSKKDIDERLTAIHCMGDYVQAYNGIISMQHYCKDIGLFSVNSDKLIRAVEACEWEPDIKLSDKTVLISSSNIKIRLPYVKDFTAQEKTIGKKSKVPKELLESLKIVQPFISEDASRSWSTSVNCFNNYLYATNNITIIRTPLKMQNATIPVDLIEVLLKVGELPKKMIMTDKAVTFIYKNKSWLQGSLTTDKWPEFVELFKKKKKLKPIPENMAEAIEKVKHFTDDDIIKVRDKNLSTSEADYAGIKISDTTISCHHAGLVLKVFDEADFTGTLIHLKGHKVEGVMATMVS